MHPACFNGVPLSRAEPPGPGGTDRCGAAVCVCVYKIAVLKFWRGRGGRPRVPVVYATGRRPSARSNSNVVSPEFFFFFFDFFLDKRSRKEYRREQSRRGRTGRGGSLKMPNTFSNVNRCSRYVLGTYIKSKLVEIKTRFIKLSKFFFFFFLFNGRLITKMFTSQRVYAGLRVSTVMGGKHKLIISRRLQCVFT